MRISQSRIGALGIPYNVGSKGLSLEKGTEALRNAGIINTLREVAETVDFGNINVSLPLPDCSNPHLLNSNQVKALCKALAEKMKTVIDAGYFPFIFGGDCSASLGIVEGLRSRWLRIGMV